MKIRLIKEETFHTNEPLLSLEEILDLKNKFDDITTNGSVSYIKENIVSRYGDNVQTRCNMDVYIENGDKSMELVSKGEGDIVYDAYENNWTQLSQNTQVVLNCGDDLSVKQYVDISKESFIYDRLDDIYEFSDRLELRVKDNDDLYKMELNESKSIISCGRSTLTVEKYIKY
ncbi:MAG: hypothetical protein ACRC92_11430 [Peptostreptococcaceae bacterium]